MAEQNALKKRLREILGPDGFLDDEAACHIYSRDASHMELGRPLGVALPTEPQQIQSIIQLCFAAGVPVVCRGTGTGLSGGALPPEGALVMATGRLNRLAPGEAQSFSIHVQPGVLNSQVSQAVAQLGLHFAPDPSSQTASSIGGNIAENAGGPHCLRHGVTLQHLRALDWCDGQGNSWSTGSGHPASRGFDLKSLLCGSEGTLGVVTGAQLNLVPLAKDETTLLAVFPDLHDATTSVVKLLGEGLLPVAVEMVDQAMLMAVEKAFAFGFPTDAQAIMICEFAGTRNETREDSHRASKVLLAAGASDVKAARDQAERLELWKCRKKAFGAVGRLAPSYVTMDVVVPLGELPDLVQEIQAIKQKFDVEIATAFHAGDGNLHPGVHYDDRSVESTRKAHQAADAIIKDALSRGGSCTGEHGVGVEKLHALPWQTDRQSARLQREIKNVFDPRGLLNPGKLIPCAEAEYADPPVPPGRLEFAWKNLTVATDALVSFREIQEQALARNLWIPVGLPLPGNRDFLAGDFFNHGHPGPGILAGQSTRDGVLELWADTGDGHSFHTGAPVFKNVAGLDLTHALCGAAGCLVTPRALTFQLRPAPECMGAWRFSFPQPPGDELGAVVDFLRRRSGSTAGSTLILDLNQQEMILLAPGRDRQWDLGSLGNDLRERWPGLKREAECQRPFVHHPEVLEQVGLPDWFTSDQSWACWSKRNDGASFIPQAQDKFVIQTHPWVGWTPDPALLSDEDSTWEQEQILGPEGFLLPSSPPANVSVDLLRKIKRVFDPHHQLATPQWLKEEPI